MFAQVLAIAFYPPLLAALGLWAVWGLGLPGRKPDERGLSRALAALPLALGFLAAFHLRSGNRWPSFPPALSMAAVEWVPYAMACASLLCAAQEQRAPRHLGRLTLCLGALAATFLGRMRGSWDAQESALWVLGAGLGSYAVLLLLEWLAQRLEGPILPFACLVAGLGVAPTLLLQRSALYAELSASLAALWGAAWVLSLLWPGLSWVGAPLAALHVGLSCLCFGGHVYGEELTPLVPALSLAAPCGALAGLLPAAVRRGALAQSLAAAAGVLLVAGASIVLAWNAAGRPSFF